MKANELMIGDYVTFKDCQHESPVIIEIVALGFQDEGEDDCLVNIGHSKACDIIELDDEIVGLPITPEILEKSGWEKYEEGEGFHDEDCVFIPQSGNSYGVCIDKKRTLSGEIRFVHELQHALRLCGIEKEIAL